MPRTLEEKREYERDWRREHYANDPEYRKRKKATDLKSYKKKLDWLAQYKLERGCARCGFDSCARALEFHHLGDKEFNLSEMKGRAWSLILAEIEKCEVLCANCHASEGCTRECRAHSSAVE